MATFLLIFPKLKINLATSLNIKTGKATLVKPCGLIIMLNFDLCRKSMTFVLILHPLTCIYHSLHEIIVRYYENQTEWFHRISVYSKNVRSINCSTSHVTSLSRPCWSDHCLISNYSLKQTMGDIIMKVDIIFSILSI